MRYNQKYAYNENIFLDENEMSYYLLGVFLTDGNLKRNNSAVVLVVKDLDWLIAIKDIICPDKPIYSREYHTLLINSTIIWNWLNDRGCTPNKSLTVKMPKIPDKYMKDFIRGCMDGDGSVSISKYVKRKNNKEYMYNKVGCYLCSSSFEFLSEFSQYLYSVGFKNSFYEVTKTPTLLKKTNRMIIPRNPHYRISFADSVAKKFLAFIYYDGCFGLLRKIKKVNEILQL